MQAFGAPPVEGLGTTGGFKIIIEDRGNLGLNELQQVSDRIVARGNKTPGLQGLFNSSGRTRPGSIWTSTATKCLALGVQVSDIFNTLQFYLGSYYVNNFNEFGRTWQVNVQADQQFRAGVGDILQSPGAEQSGTDGPARHPDGRPRHERAGGRAALQSVLGRRHHGQPGAGHQLRAGRRTPCKRSPTQDMPRSMAYDWTELVYLQLQAGNTAMCVLALAVAFVFLVLAAQYESWKLPLAIILVVPMCLLCSIVGMQLAAWR